MFFLFQFFYDFHSNPTGNMQRSYNNFRVNSLVKTTLIIYTSKNEFKGRGYTSPFTHERVNIEQKHVT